MNPLRIELLAGDLRIAKGLNQGFPRFHFVELPKVAASMETTSLSQLKENPVT